MKYTPLAAIVGICVLETIALLNNVNGATLGLAFAAIGGLGGYEVKAFMMKRKGGKQRRC